MMDARAVRLVRRILEWGVDPSRIGVLGFSAGGHLACSVANFGDDGEACSDDPVARYSSRVQALISCYAVVSSGPSGHAGSFHNLLGENPAPELLQKLSLETTVTPANPPSFIWHTFNDGAVPVPTPCSTRRLSMPRRCPSPCTSIPTGITDSARPRGAGHGQRLDEGMRSPAARAGLAVGICDFRLPRAAPRENHE